MSSILIAPYNDSMRLGQGYNSFLHRPCVLNAVKLTQSKAETTVKRQENTSQVVDYSSRFVEKISEVAKSMNVSAGSSIKNGGIIGSGSSVTLDEAKFTESDLNAVVSVKVINQTTELLGDVKFEDPGLELTNDQFFDTYGNCYISGFIEGGELIGVVSMKVMDVQNKTKIKQAIKGLVNSSGTQSEFILEENGTNKGYSAAMSKTETTITVSWSGGGQIKAENQGWTLDSLMSAAAAFPANVARCPQKTWAILTPYYHSKSFLEWSKGNSIKVPQFDGALVYANTLLDMYMEYKTLVGRIQAVLSNPIDYIPTTADNPIRVNIQELLSVRKEMNQEMKKITKTVDLISRKPEDVEEIELAAEILEPEIYATRIPIHRPNQENSDEWTTARAADILSGFSFGSNVQVENGATDKDQSGENENDETDEDKTLNKVVLQSLYAPGLEFSFMEDEKNEFSTDEARKKFEGFWVGLPVGGASGDFFNDGRHVAGVVDRADYPVLIEIQMIPHQDSATIVGWIKTHYKDFCLSNGNLNSTSAGNIRLELTEGERVVGVRMSKIQEGSGTLIGMVFIELTTSKGRVVSAGSSNGLRIANSLPDKHTQGLKGWYGRRGNAIDRLGTLWG